jgi:Cu/Ag efflux pump CusA
MMRWIVASSLRLRHVVVAAAALLLVFGFTQLTEMPVDALPEFSRPYVEIQTEALGLSAPEVEAMITTPMEADMLNGTPWAEEIRSQSIPGMSSIVLVFGEETDIMRARQVVQERLTEVFALPNVSKPPTMLNPTSSTARVMEVGLTSQTQSLIDISVLARWTIVPRLMGLPGVANVSIWGQRKRQLQVQVDPERLRDENVRLMQVIRTTGNALWASPLSYLEASTPGTGGWIDTPNQRLGVRHVLPISTAADLAQVTLDGDPSKRLGDVATVVEDHQPLIGDAFVGDGPSLVLVVEKFPWANTVEVTEQVEEALVALQPGVGDLTMDPTLYRPATYLEVAGTNLTTALIIGAVLALLALLAFFATWRTAVIGTVSVLLAAVTAGAVLYVEGTVVNLIMVAGLILAVAVIIDDVIADMDAMKRQLHRRREQGSGDSVATVIVNTVLAVRGSLLYATLIIVLFVAPAFFLEGVTGAFTRSLAMSYLLAVLASMAVALSATAALSYFLLSGAPGGRAESPLAGWLQARYDRMAARIGETPRPVFIGVAVLAVIGLGALALAQPGSSLPELRETDLLVRWEGAPSASHPAMSRITRRAADELRALPGVRGVSAQVGRAIMSDRRIDVNSGEIRVSLDPDADYETTRAAVEDVAAGYPGLNQEVLTYTQARVREELSGTRENLVVRVYGEDLDVIREKAAEIQQRLAGIDGIVDPVVQSPDVQPTIEIEVDLDRAQAYGLKPGDVRRAAAVLLSGMQVGNLFEDQKVFDVVVYGTPNTRNSLTSVQNLLIDTPGGGHVRLGDVAEVRRVPAVTVIHRDAAARRIDLTAGVRGRRVTAVAADIEGAIEAIDFPIEYRAELLGVYAERLAAQRRVLAFTAVAAVLILLLLQAFTRSWSVAIAYFLTLPAALLGGILVALAIGGGALTLAGTAGLVGVLAIAVRNGISLIGRCQSLEREGNQFSPALVRRAARERSAPAIMTAVTTALVFLPLVVFGPVAGLELIQPMSLVVLGGLVTSTLYTLVGVPALYMMFGASREPLLGIEPVSLVDTHDKDVVTAA